MTPEQEARLHRILSGADLNPPSDARIANLAATYIYHLHNWEHRMEAYEHGDDIPTPELASLALKRDLAEAALTEAVRERPDLTIYPHD